MVDKKKLKWIFIRIGIYLFAIVIVLSYIFSSLLITAAKPEPNSGPERFRISYEKVTFQTDDKVLLHGWWIQGKSGGAVILCHGIGDDKSGMVGHVPYIYRQGYSLLLFDFRGHGENEGNRTSVGYIETKDLDAAIKFVRSKGIDNIGVLGQSMGAAIAIRTAENNSSIKALVADCSYARLDETIGRYAKRLYHLPYYPVVPVVKHLAFIRTGYEFDAVNPVESIKNVHVPILLVHGLMDRNIPYGDSQRIFAAANEPKELFLVQNAGHVESHSTSQNEYELKIKGFFNKYLKQGM